MLNLKSDSVRHVVMVLAAVSWLPVEGSYGDESSTTRSEESRPADLERHEVRALSFDVPKGWKEAATNTPQTQLFLVQLNGKPGNDGVDAIIKVDIGLPVTEDLASTAAAIASRFDGETEWIHDRRVAWVQTKSSNVDLPRHAFITFVNERVYFLFVAANDTAVADETAEAIQDSLSISESKSAT